MPKTQKIGYARVSSHALDRQIAALRAEGCNSIYREKVSGRSLHKRPQLQKAIDQLGEGDVLVVAEWDRATRSMQDGVLLIGRIVQRRALLKALDKPHLDLTTKLGQGFIAFLSAMAEDERERIQKRSGEGRRLARDRGVRFGRKPKLNEDQRTEALKRLETGETARNVARTFGVSHMTILRLGVDAVISGSS